MAQTKSVDSQHFTEVGLVLLAVKTKIDYKQFKGSQLRASAKDNGGWWILPG